MRDEAAIDMRRTRLLAVDDSLGDVRRALLRAARITSTFSGEVRALLLLVAEIDRRVLLEAAVDDLTEKKDGGVAVTGTGRFADVEWIAKTEDVGVRVNTLAPRQATPWHYHSVVTDDVFCLEQSIGVELREPEETVTLQPGQRQRIAARRVHRVMNPGETPVRYLLVQATGPYDFNEVP